MDALDVLADAGPILAALAAVAVAVVLAEVLYRILRGLTRLIGSDDSRARKVGRFLEKLWERLYRPGQLLLATFAAWSAVSVYDVVSDQDALREGLEVGMVIALIWLLVSVLLVPLSAGLYALRFGGSDAARRFRSQVDTLTRVITLGVVVGVVLVALHTADALQSFSATVLAGTGLIAVLIGLAAQRSLTNTFAGIALGINKALNVGDVVEIDGQSGRIVERTLNHLVVGLSGQRQLVLPSSYLLEKPYRSWKVTRKRVVGWVPLEVDWTVPVDALEQEVHRMYGLPTAGQAGGATPPSPDASLAALLRDNPQEAVVEMISVTGAQVQLRVKVKALPDDLWGLECAVRRHLITWLRNNYPHALPRVRAEVTSPGTAAPALPAGGTITAAAAPSQPTSRKATGRKATSRKATSTRARSTSDPTGG